MRGELDGAPSVTYPNLAELEGKDRITRLGVWYMLGGEVGGWVVVRWGGIGLW